MMTYAELQTLETHGIPRTEYRQQPELESEQRVELGDTQYITVVQDPQKPRNHYLITLLNRFTQKEQRVDLVIQESGFTPMVNEIRKHFGYGWEVFAWQDCEAPF